ncbi:MAG TPA: ComEC/Rec2 family competence protein [Hyphomicrobiaceae bacterium]|nr:ComEC/Rec2 family competence protein [Hyphomicrobiaceae bacterium]
MRLGAALAERFDAEQERWFLWLPVLFGAGIAIYFMLPAEPWTLAALVPAAAAIVAHLAAARTSRIRLLTAALLAVSLGVGAAKVRTEAMRAPVLAERIGPVDVEGYVELVEPRATGGQRVTVRVRRLGKLDPDATPYRARVTTRAANKALQPGDLVRLRATLNPPPGPSLPGGYDFARMAWFQALGAVGYARDPAQVLQDAAGAPARLRWATAVERVRETIGARIVAALPGQEGAIANALITGERGGIAESTNQAFRASGLFHILSISGLHMVIMAGAVFFSIRVLLAAIPAIALRYPIKKWAAAGAMAGAFAYLLISGSSPPTVRSYAMISVMFLAVLLDRAALALRNVALAAFGILIVWPESLFDPGFQMSFAAVVALVSAYEWLHERTRARADAGPAAGGVLARGTSFFGGILLSTLIAGLAVAPFGVYHFHNTQQFAMLANLLAIPLCNVVVMPAALATLLAMPFGLEAPPLWVMGWGIRGMVWVADAVAALPGAVGRVPAIPTVAFAAMIAGGLWLTLWRTRWRLLGLIPMLVGLALAPTAARPDLLVGRDVGLVAVRGADGELSALAERGAMFELARWLETDGSRRPPAEAAKGQAFHCDEAGCTARVKGLLLAVANTPEALRDDCAAAAIVVLKFARPTRCARPAIVIDAGDVRRRGTHALYLEDGRIRIETLADTRGARPWTPQTGEADDASEAGGDAQNLRINPTSRP